jgi:hypothetical protein
MIANSPRPRAPQVDFRNIPAELRRRDRWVLWRYVRKPGGDWTKLPYQPSGASASTTNPATWSTLEQVRTAYARSQGNSGAFDGVGIVLGDGLVGLDFDDILPEDGTPRRWAAALADQFPTYQEVSPSGRGVKLFVLGEFEGPGIPAQHHPEGGALEAYARDRYFTVTGRPFGKSVPEVARCDEALGQTIERLRTHQRAERDARARPHDRSQPPDGGRAPGGAASSDRSRAPGATEGDRSTGRGDRLSVGSPYGRKALEGECRQVAGAREGARNSTLNEAAFRIGQLVAGGELEGAASRVALREAAAACGLPEREAAAVVERALRDGGDKGARWARAGGGGSHDPSPHGRHPTPPGGGSDWPSPSTAASPENRGGDRRNTAPPETIDYQIKTAAQFAAGDYHVEEAVGQIMVERQPMVILGPRKGLKTSLGLALALSLAGGVPYLGRFPVRRPRRVLFMSGESGLSTLQETARRQCRAMGVELEQTGNFHITDRIPQISNLHHLDALQVALEDFEIETLFIDPLYLALDAGGNESSVYAMGAILRGIAERCQTMGVTLVLLHHLRKSDPRSARAPTLDDASWSGVAEFARQWLIVSRSKPYQPGSGEHQLRLDVGGSAGHSGQYGLLIGEGTRLGGRHWSVAIEEPDERRERERRESQAASAERRQRSVDGNVAKLRRALLKFNAGETAKRLRELAGMNLGAFSEAIDTLLGRGEAAACELTKGKRKFEGYRPTERLKGFVVVPDG